MKLSKLSLVLAVIAMALVGCGEANIAKEPSLVRPVKIIEISNLIAPNLRSFPARIEASQEASLSFRISGELSTLPLLEGQEVTEGMVLAQLDHRDEKNNLLLAEADFELSESDFNRKAELFGKKLISKSEFDSAKAKLKIAKANLSSAKDRLSYTSLVAPFSGIVAYRAIDNFQTVQAGQTILILHRSDAFDVEIQVPESFIQELNQNLIAGNKPDTYVRFNGMPTIDYPVEFKESSTQISTGSQSYKTTFLLEQPDDLKILPGMSAELYIDLNSSKQNQSIIVPVSAVATRGIKDSGETQSIVWLFDPESGVVNAVPVTLGKISAEGIEITSGISRDAHIVSTGIQHLSEGMKVKPLTWQRGV